MCCEKIWGSGWATSWSLEAAGTGAAAGAAKNVWWRRRESSCYTWFWRRLQRYCLLKKNSVTYVYIYIFHYIPLITVLILIVSHHLLSDVTETTIIKIMTGLMIITSSVSFRTVVRNLCYDHWWISSLLASLFCRIFLSCFLWALNLYKSFGRWSTAWRLNIDIRGEIWHVSSRCQSTASTHFGTPARESYVEADVIGSWRIWVGSTGIHWTVSRKHISSKFGVAPTWIDRLTMLDWVLWLVGIYLDLFRIPDSCLWIEEGTAGHTC